MSESLPQGMADISEEVLENLPQGYNSITTEEVS